MAAFSIRPSDPVATPTSSPIFTFSSSRLRLSRRCRTPRACLKLSRTIPIRTQRKRHLRLLAQPRTARIRAGWTPCSAIPRTARLPLILCEYLRRGRNGRGRGRRSTSGARGEDGFVVGRADLEGHLGFGTDEGAAGVVGGGTSGDGLAGAGRGVDCCWGSGGLLVGCQLFVGLLAGKGGEGSADG